MTSDSIKNITKYESYKYAFERLQEALDQEFFLEAVMIAESIVAERLLSYLTFRLKATKSDRTLNPRAALKQLIEQWEKLDGSVVHKERQNLISDIDQWRGDRNECAHGLVKSNPGDPTKPVEEFRLKARECATR
jgi:hypothetical protein